MSNLASAALALQQAQSAPIVQEPAPNTCNPNTNAANVWASRRQQHMLLGQEFKLARQKKYMSQWDVALKTQLSRRTISRVEQSAYAKVDTLMTMASALDMELTLKPTQPAIVVKS